MYYTESIFEVSRIGVNLLLGILGTIGINTVRDFQNHFKNGV